MVQDLIAGLVPRLMTSRDDGPSIEELFRSRWLVSVKDLHRQLNAHLCHVTGIQWRSFTRSLTCQYHVIMITRLKNCLASLNTNIELSFHHTTNSNINWPRKFPHAPAFASLRHPAVQYHRLAWLRAL
jgi:hypothetical protein